ncbi:MAG TPA: 50S ribosomal protein L11 methyltransferase [Thermoleophilaceae bacterium]|nr:50S ribosomal protein L11 methyltransferase [Thermoleophilaceae bacterium]
MIRLAIRARAEHAERVLAGLLELAPAGLEQVDHSDGSVEFALYGAPAELPAFPAGEAELAGVRVHVSGEEVAEDWAERWREFHRPVLVGERLWVRPPWAAPRDGALDLVIDPAQAFGTGAHPTTRLSLELLLALEPAGPLADLGCGSGVLAIAAAKLGFAPVTAFDNEPAAIDATCENARANAIRLERVERIDLREQPAPWAPTTTANLVRPLLLRLAELDQRRPERMIVSGLLDGEEDEVAAALAPMREERRLGAAGWSALLLVS